MKHKHVAFVACVFAAGILHAQITLNPVPSRAVGTPALTVASANPNLVEGRELYAPQGIALDNSVSPPRLYVSDYANNRVLAWDNSATFTSGQPAKIVLGQPDLFTTFAEGPGVTQFGSGLTRPAGLAVDAAGNLYVADTGNNRVLRYPAPFAQNRPVPVPDLTVGQLTSSSGRGTNYPSGQVNPQGININNSSLVCSLALDSAGNLWVSDVGNARVLRFNAADLNSGVSGGLTSDLVLGQTIFTSGTGLNSGDTTSYLKLDKFVTPTALAFDASGNLWVGDYRRALIFAPPFSSGMAATPRILGQYPSGTTPTQTQIDQTGLFVPAAFFFLTGDGTGVGVVDASASRIMIFDVLANWPKDGTPPVAKYILGQANTCPLYYVDQACKYPNDGNPQASGSVFSLPGGAAYTGKDLYVVDSGNHRVLDLPQQGGTFGAATRVLGQDNFIANSPNLIEGREFDFTGTLGSNTFSDAGMAIDNHTGTPHLYVSDPYNNRVLGFYDMRKFQNGGKNKADIVLGQADFTTSLRNYPSGDANKQTKSGLYRPVGLLVDSQGNLYVADSGNGRVLRFPAPFFYAGRDGATSAGAVPEPADLVLGQQNFTSRIPDPSATNMFIPYGLAFSPSCNTATQACPNPNGLVVSDQGDNRVLYIPTTNGGFVAGIDNGKAATIVFGQKDFLTISADNALTRMNGPHHVACDAQGYVYVADTGNSRVLIFPDPAGNGTPTAGEAASATITGVSTPEGVYVSPSTGEIWVTNTGSNTPNTLRYRDYASVLLNLSSSSSIDEVSGNHYFHPLAAIQDQYGNLLVADDANRVAIYYSGMGVFNGASFVNVSVLNHGLAPGVIASIFPCATCSGTQFLANATPFSSYPVPLSLGDVSVLVDNVPSPLYYVSGGQINFVVPNGARTSGSADIQVVQTSTQQVLGAALVPMYLVAPGAFAYPGGQTGATIYAAAVNEDGTVNSAANPAQRGHYISLYMTGQGNVPNAPADGVPASVAISAPAAITVVVNGYDVNSPVYAESNQQHVLYSGLNQYPGMWQINVKLPATVATTAGVWFAVIADGVSNWDSASGFRTYIYVK